ncbi:MAG: hypothetical protein IPP71_15660 [Bacteroidetes bacterium]|nr:hypothetical protein [Bacteroidota bacterium]
MKKSYKATLIMLLLLIPVLKAFPQVVYQHVDNTSIYEFLDEMANMKFIELNSAVKPYSRIFIAKNWYSSNQMWKH